MKKCSICGKLKPLDNFHAMKQYLSSWCKSCKKIKDREWVKNNPEKNRAKSLKHWRKKFGKKLTNK